VIDGALCSFEWRCWRAWAWGGRSFIVNIDYSGPDFKSLLDSKERELIQAAL